MPTFTKISSRSSTRPPPPPGRGGEPGPRGGSPVRPRPPPAVGVADRSGRRDASDDPPTPPSGGRHPSERRSADRRHRPRRPGWRLGRCPSAGLDRPGALGSPIGPVGETPPTTPLPHQVGADTPPRGGRPTVAIGPGGLGGASGGVSGPPPTAPSRWGRRSVRSPRRLRGHPGPAKSSRHTSLRTSDFRS